MANIHGIGDFSPDNDRDRQQRQGFMGGGQAGFDPNTQVPNFLTPLFRQSDTNPRKQGFFQMLHETLCPTLTIKSFIFLVSVVELLSFIISLVGTLVNSTMPNDVFLGVGSDILNTFNKDPKKIVQSYQVWRVATPIFLHVGFSHMAMNFISQLIFGSLLEGMVGFFHTCLLYFASGIGANIFSSVCQFEGTPSVGASTSINGLLTGLLAMIIVNWSAFDGNQMLEQVRCCLMFFVALCIVLNLMMGVNVSNSKTRSVDTVGHIGGAIVGLFWGLAFLPRVAGPTGQKCRVFGIAATVIFFVLFTGLLFGLHMNKSDAS